MYYYREFKVYGCGFKIDKYKTAPSKNQAEKKARAKLLLKNLTWNFKLFKLNHPNPTSEAM